MTEEEDELSFGAPEEPSRVHFGWNQEDPRAPEDTRRAEKDWARCVAIASNFLSIRTQLVTSVASLVA